MKYCLILIFCFVVQAASGHGAFQLYTENMPDTVYAQDDTLYFDLLIYNPTDEVAEDLVIEIQGGYPYLDSVWVLEEVEEISANYSKRVVELAVPPRILQYLSIQPSTGAVGASIIVREKELSNEEHEGHEQLFFVWKDPPTGTRPKIPLEKQYRVLNTSSGTFLKFRTADERHVLLYDLNGRVVHEETVRSMMYRLPEISSCVILLVEGRIWSSDKLCQSAVK